jgi:uncharacterized protein YfaS (alpha-2-macroglobulin family)
LKLKIEVPKKVIRPETTLQTVLKISGAMKGQKTYVTLAAVDVGVLNITNYKSPNPFKWFFEPRRYGVDQHDIYNKIIALVEGGVTKARFGGDANEDQHAGGERPDSKLKIVSLFSGLVETDAQGLATINLAIPDFNGRLRLMAVAFNDQQLGASETEVTISAPIIAEVSLPRFLAAGDQAELTLDLRNQTDVVQNISLKLSSTAPVLLVDNRPLNMRLQSKEKQVVRLPILAENNFGQAEIHLTLNNAKNAKEAIHIKRKWTLGVRPAYPASTLIQRRMIRQGDEVTVLSQTTGLLINSATATLNISSSPPIAIKNHLKQLLQYPYGCLEQTISSTYPWLSIDKTKVKQWGLNQFTIRNQPINFEKKNDYIEQSINRLLGMQRSNGGFGLWSNKGNEEHWLTVYAVDFLLDAKAQGVNVPEEMLNKAFKRLTEYINHRGKMYGQGYSHYPLHTSFAYKSYAAYVLSRVNRVPLGSLRTLFDLHHKKSHSGLPLVHLGIALINQGDKKKGNKAVLMGIQKTRNAHFYLGDYGSPLRDMTLMTYLLNKHAILPHRATELIFKLGDELGYRSYLSTQEQNALFRTGVLLQAKSQKSWQGKLVLGNNLVAENLIPKQGRYQRNFKQQSIPELINFSSEGNIPLYLQYEIQAYPKTSPPMKMEVIQIERNYYNLQGQAIVLDKIKRGQVVLVHLNINTTKRIKDALIVDLIPAGFEIENQNLANSLKIDTFEIQGQSIEQMQYDSHLSYEQYLGDRYIGAVDLYKGRTRHGFYLMRAVTKGVFINPPPYVEDMYRPYIRGVGRAFNPVTIY